MSGYLSEYHQSTNMSDVSGTVVIGPINIQHYDKFSLYFKNFATAVAVVQVDLALDKVGSASTLDFVSANTAVIPTPSALAASGVTGVMTSAINNTYKWLRVTAHTTACNSIANSGQLLMAIGGHRRR